MTQAVSPAVVSAVAAALCAAVPAAHAAEEPRELGRIQVTEDADANRDDIASSPKYTAPLTDTPQTITVVTRETMAEQNLLSLRDVLSTVPGITFGAGEGGGGYGDSITLRGFTGSNDVTVDGIRDSAQYTRSDPFNLEQVEVINGANSVYSGAGSVGGTINLVNKTAEAANFHRAAIAGGTDGYARVTGDFNQTFGDGAAVRLNVMGHRNDVPGRDVENNRRWGVAPSVAFGLGSSTTLTLSYLHQHDKNIPQYGIPTFDGRVMPGVDAGAYYGYRNLDRQDIDSDMATAILSHVFSERFALRNLTRWQQVTQYSLVDPPQGTFCLANGLQPTGAACPAGYLPDQYQPSGPRGNVRDTTNRMLINQTDATLAFDTGPLTHTLVVGAALSSESYDFAGGNVLRTAGGATLVLPRTAISAPDSLYVGPQNTILTSTIDGRLDNRAVYAFDNIQFSPRWSLNGGVRVERNDASFHSVAYALPSAGGAATPALPAENTESLATYRAGVVFKPTSSSSVYVAYGNTQTPSVATVNGSCAVGAANSNCNLDPEEGRNIEIGTKWDVMDNRLSLTAALSRNERTNYRVNDPGNPDNPSAQQTLDGEARVDAVLLGAVGRLTDHWAVYANYTWLDSEVLQGASQYVSSLGQDYTRGDALANVPKHAASLWTTWDVMRGVQVGYGATYQGKVFVQQHSATNVAGPLPSAAGYIVHRAMASYSFNRHLSLQLNVNNLFDKEYLTRVRTQQVAWATPGEARSFVLAANMTF
jgi:catecholate siderophore receptor